MKRRKIPSRLLAWLLAVVILAGLLPVMANAEKITTVVLKKESGITWIDPVDLLPLEQDENSYYEENKMGFQVESDDEQQITLTLTGRSLSVAVELDEDKIVSLEATNGVTCTFDSGASFIAGRQYVYRLGNLTKATAATTTITASIQEPDVTVTMPALREANGIYRITAAGTPSTLSAGANAISYDSDFSFKLIMSDSSKNYIPHVHADKSDGTEMDVEVAHDEGALEYTFTIKKITEDIDISVTLDPPVTVTLTPGNNYSIAPVGGSTTIPYNTDFSFTVTPVEGYKVKEVRSSTQTAPLGLDEGKENQYTLKNVTRDATISVVVEQITYKVTIQHTDKEHPGYTVTVADEETVPYGGTFSFTLNTTVGYNTPSVTADGAQVEVSGTTYTVRNVQKDIKITIGKADKQKITVHFPSVTGATFNVTNPAESVGNDATVDYGSTVTFDLTVQKGYSQSKFTLSFNGRTYDAEPEPQEDGAVKYSYTLANVTVNGSVTVTGIERNTYKVTIDNQAPTGYSYTITSGSTSVRDGDDFTFTLSKTAGYENPTIQYKLGEDGVDAPVTFESGHYIIENITSDLTITISGEMSTYQINTPKGEHFTFSAVGGSRETVNYNDDYSFTLTPSLGYKIVNVFVTIGSNKTAYPLTSENGNTRTYTINDIQDHVTIEVETAPVTVTVTYLDAKNTGHTSETVTYTIESEEDVDKEGGVITLHKPAGLTLFDEGVYSAKWLDQGQSERNTLTIGYADAEYTLTANYTVQWQNVYKFELQHQWGGSAEDSVYAIQITVSPKAAEIEELRDATVAGYGIFFSLDNFSSETARLTTYLQSDSVLTSAYTKVGSHQGNNSIDCCNASFFSTFGDVGGSTSYTVNIGGFLTSTYQSGPPTSYVQPWLVLRDGDGEKHVILGTFQTLVDDRPKPEMADAHFSDMTLIEEMETAEVLDDLTLGEPLPADPIPAPADPAPVPSQPMPVDTVVES